MDKKDPSNPATTSFEWDAMIETWTMIETLLGGTESMRAAGSLYLFQHAAETDPNYVERLSSNYLFNMLELTLDGFVGRPFSSPVELNEDVPDEIRELTENIDLLGNDLSVFCREWFREGVAKGFAHVYIDMPALPEEELEGRTLEDDRREGRRPYWNLIKPENVIFAASEVRQTDHGPAEFLTQVRIAEEVTEQNGFAQEVIQQIRVLEPGLWTVWRLVKEKKRGKPVWRAVDGGETGLDFIPFITYYAERSGFMMSKPPLEDLAHMNVRWWQSNSDQINVLTVARFPMLAVAGATSSTGTEMAIGPRQLLGTRDANGKFYYVEHTGSAIEAGRGDLDDLEEKMSSYGAEFLKRKPGNETATGRALDSAEAISPLQDLTVRFVDSVNNALAVTGAWVDVEEAGTVTITTDFGPEEFSDADQNMMEFATRERYVSRLALIDFMIRRGQLPPDYDAEADLEQLRLEVDDLADIRPIVPGTIDPSELKDDSPNRPSKPTDSTEGA
jgi:hypothetical protein